MKCWNMSQSEDPCPDFRWPVGVTQRIKAPADKLWSAISMPGNLEHCHPFCASNPVERWPGPESRDQIHYLNGWVLERRFCSWIEHVGYDLTIGRRGGRSSFVSWRMQTADPEHTSLRITVYPHAVQNWPLAIRWIPHILRIRPLLRRYLSSVTRGFEWYVTRNQPVSKNQFGSHPWFS